MKNIGIMILFGFVAGIMGGVFVSSYMDSYNYSQFKNVLLNSYANKKGIVIERAEKITIEQGQQIKDVINLNQEKIVEIYKKKEKHDGKILVLGEYYQRDKNIVNGLIITSDGWIIVRDFFAKKQDLKNVLDDYIVVDYHNKIYKIDDFKRVERGIFLHLAGAKELPVTNIVSEADIEKGEIVVALNKHKNINVSYIAGESEDFVKSCDKLTKEVILTSDKKFRDSFLFDIGGGLISLSDENGSFFLVDNLKFEILNLLDADELKKPLWGMSYVNLSDMAIASSSVQKKGALIYNDKGDAISKGGVAEKIGLMENDIIVFVNSSEINADNSLNYILQDYKIGDNLDITYIRDGEKKIINIDI